MTEGDEGIVSPWIEKPNSSFVVNGAPRKRSGMHILRCIPCIVFVLVLVDFDLFVRLILTHIGHSFPTLPVVLESDGEKGGGGRGSWREEEGKKVHHFIVREGPLPLHAVHKDGGGQEEEGGQQKGTHNASHSCRIVSHNFFNLSFFFFPICQTRSYLALQCLSTFSTWTVETAVSLLSATFPLLPFLHPSLHPSLPLSLQPLPS